ncbi:MAG TPA: hypothetical protein VKJ07_15660, partial [Mycobacteriales bacterium]|nr:hypothetical protein [Mycobacteriales bacterium]
LHLLPEASGSVLVTGGIGTSDAPYIARVDATGALDQTFGAGGYVKFPAHYGVSTSTDGKAIYVAYTGRPQGPGSAEVTVTKLTMAGAVDPKFGDAGSVSWLEDYRWTNADDAVLRDGRLTILGDATDSAGTDDPMFLLRYIVDRHAGG